MSVEYKPKLVLRSNSGQTPPTKSSTKPSTKPSTTSLGIKRPAQLISSSTSTQTLALPRSLPLTTTTPATTPSTTQAKKNSNDLSERACSIERFIHLKGLVSDKLIQTLTTKMGFDRLSVAQSSTIKPLLSRRDLILKSKTGSGKTIAFLLPIIQRMIGSANCLRALVISPTRELALQIQADAQILTENLGLKVGISIGGTNIKRERADILAGVDILIGTPGRLNDHLSDPLILQRVKKVESFVLDECDRLLDMGFINDIFKIRRCLSANNMHTILCSATTTPDLLKVAKELLSKDYDLISTIAKGEADTHKKVPQFLIETTFNDQLKMTLSLLEREFSPTFKAVVFLPTAHLANLYHATALCLPLDTQILVQHSRQPQKKRTQVSNTFRDCVTGILFATDVVARGMDFPNVSHVVQVGIPDSIETYVHRAGRTGRAGLSGVGYLILAHAERSFFNQLISQGLPISQTQLEISESAVRVHDTGASKFITGDDGDDDGNNCGRVYQSWLGYYKGQMKHLKARPVEVVAIANSFILSLGARSVPALDRKTVGKMGLKGVEGLNIK